MPDAPEPFMDAISRAFRSRWRDHGRADAEAWIASEKARASSQTATVSHAGTPNEVRYSWRDLVRMAHLVAEWLGPAPPDPASDSATAEAPSQQMPLFA